MRTTSATRFAFVVLLSGVGTGRAEAGQDARSPLTIQPLWPSAEFLAGRAPIAFELSRRLQPSERLALVIGTMDVSAVLEVRGTRAVYRPHAVRLPAGRSEAVVYVVTAGGEWLEAGRFALNVRTRAGFDEGRFLPSADLSSTGQLDQGVPIGETPPDRRTYQDLTLRFGVESSVGRDGWQVAVQGNALGITEERQRLRFGTVPDAPAFDLSDYRVQVARGPARLALGNVSTGAHRYLLNGFASRGLTGGLRLGRAAAVEAGVVNGTGVVGWSNLLGLARPEHRMASLTLALELMPDRPGGAHVDVAGFNGSVLPRASFNQGAVTDAEESRGLGLQFSLSDASQRIRLAGGFSRSSFVNPADPFLARDTTIVAVRSTTRSARFAELSSQILRGVTLGPSLVASLAATARHERVDPLYRSVGAFVQSDMESNGVELTGALGAFMLQAAASGSRDNLAEIGSILTTRTRIRNANGVLPLGALVRAGPEVWYWPAVTASWQEVRQVGEGVPVNGDFAESHVPDQVSTNRSLTLAWMRGVWNLRYGWNRSDQDNRQTGREQADFRATVHTLGLGLTPASRISSSLDVGIERQDHLETGTTQRLERLGGSAQIRVLRHTALSGAVTHSRSEDPFARQWSRNTEFNAELSQGFTAYGRRDGGTQGRLFVRYARRRAALQPFEPATLISPLIRWTLTAGGSFRLY